MIQQPVVLATGNPHKVDELRPLLAEAGIAVVGLRDLPDWQRFQEPAETGATFEENAAIKARAYAQQTGRWCLADDSGLEVDALEGAPGVISSHYASRGIDTGLSRPERDAANNDALLAALDGLPDAERTARFVCVMCLAAPDGAIAARARGTFEGAIGRPGDVPRGENGFGYDPLFVLEDGRTSAELSPIEKNARSHRGHAARSMALLIAGLSC